MTYLTAFVDVRFSDIALIKYLVLCLLLFLVLRIVQRYSPHLFRRRKHKDLFRVIFPIAEFFLWIYVQIRGVEYFMSKNILVAIGILILLSGIALCLSWYALRDLIAGVVFKSSGRIRLKEIISLGMYSGKVINFRLFSLEMETNNGEIAYIPYHRIISTVNIKTKTAEMTGYHNFIIKTEKKLAINNMIDILKNEIYSLPWIIIDKEPKVNLKEETPQEYIIDISIYTIDQQYNINAEKALRDRLAEI